MTAPTWNLGQVVLDWNVKLAAPFDRLRADLLASPGRQQGYIVAPKTQGANSAPPKSKLSLLVG
jgi:hypothetical protein